MDFKTYLPVILRYALTIIGSYLAAHGLLSPEQQSYFSGQIDVIVGALIALGMFGVALYTRRSTKALAAAKAIDKTVPSDAPVVIKTPEGLPDIHIPAKP